MANGEAYRELGEAAWAWVLGQVRQDGEGPWFPETVVDGGTPPEPRQDRDSFYAGIVGLAPLLAEIAQYRELNGTERALSAGIVAKLSAEAARRVEPSLYDGLAGDVMALRLLSPGAESAPLRRLGELATPEGWATTLEFEANSSAPLSDVTMGTAGVVMTALWAPTELTASLAATGCEALLAAADRTPAGLDWGISPRTKWRNPNYSHGTAGIAAALALAGADLGRPDFAEAAVEGARHLLAVGELTDGGFVVPHTIPPSSREVEPLTYTWCHGPAGTSFLFAALAYAGVPEVGGFDVRDLRRRCLSAVLASGVPARLRPGFWDNDGRCCGTAGVGDVLLDAAQDGRDERLLDAARTMGDALIERAVHGAYWQFVEYRNEDPLLPPGTAWMQGAAGIAAYLLRLARVVDSGLDAPVVDRPDQWWAVPQRLRVAQPV
ncbi:lanthionine synthetase LanC family protein [Kitasatospora sp. NPDC006697]|uniref:lanthionine synthetase LanC family protein n=1 Tax=Kitasatospora sp. NPDC006697 TaxID=3364020 RepID=UPI00369C33FD